MCGLFSDTDTIPSDPDSDGGGGDPARRTHDDLGFFDSSPPGIRDRRLRGARGRDPKTVRKYIERGIGEIGESREALTNHRISITASEQPTASR
jgi:hypothetical protein